MKTKSHRRSRKGDGGDKESVSGADNGAVIALFLFFCLSNVLETLFWQRVDGHTTSTLSAGFRGNGSSWRTEIHLKGKKTLM